MRADAAIRIAGFAAALVLIANLFVLGAQPFAVGLIPPPWDKLAHAALFALLGVLLMTAAAGRYGWFVLVALVLIGIADELAQTDLPGRVMSLADLAADVVGATAGITAMAFVLTRRADR